MMGTDEAYELVEHLGGPLWRVRGPDLADYTMVRSPDSLVIASRVRHVRTAGMAALADHGVGHLVYENLPGTDLNTEVRKHGPLRGPRLAELLRVTARVLADLHRAGTAHGGLTPERVFLDGDRVLVAGPVATGVPASDLLAWADLARFAAGGDGAAPLPADLADLVIDCGCWPADRRPAASEVCRRVELLAVPRPHLRDPWLELGRRIRAGRRAHGGDWRVPVVGRRVPRPIARAYDELFGTTPMLELLYQFAVHDEQTGGPRDRRRRGDHVRWELPEPPHGTPRGEVTVRVTATNSGRVHWHNRFLRRSGPTYGPHVVDAQELVAVPDTAPGGVATVPVRLTLPGGAGMYGQRMTLVDEDGRCRLGERDAHVVVRACVDP